METYALVAVPHWWNSIIRQNPTICNPPLYIAVTFEQFINFLILLYVGCHKWLQNSFHWIGPLGQAQFSLDSKSQCPSVSVCVCVCATFCVCFLNVKRSKVQLFNCKVKKGHCLRYGNFGSEMVEIATRKRFCWSLPLIVDGSRSQTAAASYCA